MMRASPSALRLPISLLLVAATLVFALGTLAERRALGEPAPVARTASPALPTRAPDEGQSASRETGEGHADTDAGATGPRASSAAPSEAGVEQHEPDDEALLGSAPESPAALIAVIVGSLLLAAAVWWRPGAVILALVVVVGLLSVAFDGREVLHQARAANALLVGVAVLVAAVHLAVAGLAGLALLRRPEMPAPAVR